MDIKIEKKKYLVPRKYWAWIGGGAVLITVLIWLGLSNFSSTLKVDRKGLSIGTVEKAQFNDYVSVDGQVVPISVVQISSEEGGIVLEKVVDEGAHVNKGDVIVKLSNSNLDLEILVCCFNISILLKLNNIFSDFPIRLCNYTVYFFSYLFFGI